MIKLLFDETPDLPFCEAEEDGECIIKSRSKQTVLYHGKIHNINLCWWHWAVMVKNGGVFIVRLVSIP
jgi:hypothetical protein